MDDKQFNTLYFAIVTIGVIQVGLLAGIVTALLILLDKLG